MFGLPMGALMTLASLGIDLAPAIAGAVPGKIERRLRKQSQADAERLAGGGGGMSAGKRQEMQAQAANQIRGAQGELMAQAARGSATGALNGPQATQVMLGAGQQAQEQMRQAQSDIRAQDLALAEEQRAQNMNLQGQLIGLGQQRKSAWLKPLSMSDRSQQALSSLVPGRATQAANVAKITPKAY